MGKKLYLNFLWHMHQPYYKDDMAGYYAMPWVYLHAIKDYYDMVWYLSSHPKLKATFNLVPSLLVQLHDYETTAVNDLFIRTLSKEVELLSNEERLYLMEFLFFAQKETMIAPIGRYAELYRKVENNKNTKERVKLLEDNELLDLEVCFLLAWCGEYLRENSPLVQKLLTQYYFTPEEKRGLLEELADFIKQIVPFYKRLQENGQIEISTTPFYHPIMPLLMDPNNAALANSNVLMPNNPLAFQEDADEHVSRAIAYYEELFGKRPKGVWPSEGSVDNESLSRYIGHNLVWACTDEAILFKSVPESYRELIYGRCRLKNSEGEIALAFRDRSLSDAIGFDYSRMNPEAAASDFIGRLRRIYEGEEGSRQINVILDGENAWEFYRKNGKDFFDALYRALESADWIVTQTMSQASVNPEVREIVIDSIIPGSWINGDFAIWMGQEEKNRAWELLYQAKRDFDKVRGSLDADAVKFIRKELMIAQGSDWYWWFGDTHYTVQKGEFDQLFRKHLKNIYLLMNQAIPENLYVPLITYQTHEVHTLPKNTITIGNNGLHSSFFEWMGAGEFNLEKMGSVMDSSTPFVKKVLYGNDTKKFNIALVGNFDTLNDKTRILIHLDGVVYGEFPFKYTLSDTMMIRSGKSFVEISVPIETLPGEHFDLGILLAQGGEMLQNIPFHGALTIDMSNRFPGHWFI
ncbi:MAG: glycoside hydrolase family 57 protein [Sulfuricurvum sp.]|jgi:alpha-amylase/alpha-mannosidase (GH57 family)|uniref:glycoside hydrolase family 57 protein n=1 Tax=Sulfuricurvum sp. TaxID=2025608 RepID=UPI0025D44339|nr:glycoside hydrolase family 57 protein [Sulfuricurvum sp.]MCK9372335.1 glycoside hydrolase family 57 protein [Sulfuricurvum sp.]